MDPVTLGVVAAGFIAASLEKAAEKAISNVAEKTGEGLGDAAHSVATRLLGWLRAKLTPGNGARLELVEAAPDSKKAVMALADSIAEQADADAGFRTSLEELVREAEQAGVVPAQYIQKAKGNRNVQVAGSSQVTVSIGSTPASQNHSQ